MLDVSGLRVLVVGLGISGYSTARGLLARHAKVRVTESADSEPLRERAEALRAEGAEVELGGHDLGAIAADLAVVSPGIPPAAAILTALRRAGVDIISDVELAYRVATCDFLAVTGTNGKTTTTTLLARMLEAADIPSVAAGNIGLPLLDAIDQVPSGGAIALEVSSFQLAATHTFRPRAACILNIAVDHLDWHPTVADYAASKARITANQTSEDALIVNLDDPVVMSIAATSAARISGFSVRTPPHQGIGVREGMIVWRGRELIAAADVPLTGLAGLADALAAAGTALEFGLEREPVVRAIRAFRPLRHRLEVVAEAGGVRYVDDSKATNPHATLAAVAGARDVVLIAGGRSKGIDLAPLRGTVPAVVAVVALGEAADEVERVFEGLVPVDRASSMAEAVRLAAARSVPSGSVLLSPGCASLDMYGNYAERGDDFTSAVRDLVAERGEEGSGRSARDER